MTLLRATFLSSALLAVLWAAGARSIAGQVPTDSVPQDSVRPDTIRGEDHRGGPAQDSLDAQVPDSVRQVQDSVAPRDTLPQPYNLPEMPGPVPEGFHTGVWEWDREDLLGTRALTLAELLAELPGAVALLGGDFGMPRAVSVFGVGGGRIRIFWDGMELPPLEGGAADLSRIGLGGISRVRVERRGGELRVELRGLQNEDPRPYSLVEVGTGDLDTNLFRGTFSHPRALGGSVGVALDRIDTDGPAREEPGAATGGWLRYALHRGDRAGLVAEVRRMTTNRDTLFEPTEVTRTDLALRGRAEITPGLVVGGFYGRSSQARPEEPSDDSAQAAMPLNEESRNQYGLKVGLERPWFWVEGGFTRRSGEGWPSGTARLGGGVQREGVGGVQSSVEWEDWPQGDGTTAYHLRGWTAPVGGFSLFGELEDGRRGVPYVPPMPADTTSENAGGDAEPTPSLLRFTDRRFTRYGVLFDRWGLGLGAARMELEADSLAVLGLPMDGDGKWSDGGIRDGFEVFVRAPLFLGPLRFLGTYQEWDEDPERRWRYLPERSWDARLAFHDTYFDSEDLELWAELGVRGRDPMAVPFEPVPVDPGDDGAGEEEGEGETAPADSTAIFQEVRFRQTWYAWIEVRIVTVRVFIRWENLTNKDDNFDFPGRRLTGTRALYGVRWTLWN